MGNLKHIHKGRYFLFSFYRAVLATFLLAATQPAFISCTSDTEAPGDETQEEETPTGITLKSPPESKAARIDIFFFNDDRLMRLDSYQRIESPATYHINGASRSGKKIIAVIANSPTEKFSWPEICSFETLQEHMEELAAENPELPVMTGVSRVEAGIDKECIILMEPLLSKIILNSISCDFSGHPYKDARIEDVRIYLTNVNGRCPALREGTSNPESIINYGRYTEEDLATFVNPEILSATLNVPVGNETIFPDIRLYCYPNTCTEEAPGSPFTRLVIEGTIEGETYFWPLNINREGFGFYDGEAGIQRNRCYSFDITITRKGSTDPDIPVETGSFGIALAIKQWGEKKGTVIKYRI